MFTITLCPPRTCWGLAPHRTSFPADPKFPEVVRTGLPWTASGWTWRTELRSFSTVFSLEPWRWMFPLLPLVMDVVWEQSFLPVCDHHPALFGGLCCGCSSAPGRTFPNMGCDFLHSLLAEVSRGDQNGGVAVSGPRTPREVPWGAEWVPQTYVLCQF